MVSKPKKKNGFIFKILLCGSLELQINILAHKFFSGLQIISLE